MSVQPRQPASPFETAILRDLWDDPPDVPAIHAGVSEALLHELECVVRTGESSGVVIQGDAGTGKTHLLTRLRRSATVRRLAHVVHVPPLAGGPAGPYRHVLDHLVRNLQRTPPGATMSPIRRIFVSFVTRRVLERPGRIVVSRRDLAGLRRRAWRCLREQAPAADPDVLRALEALVRGKEILAHEWLRGRALDPGARREIGVGRNIEGEDPALRAIEAIAALAALAEPRRVLLLAFDPIDADAEPDRRRRLAEVAAGLVQRPNHLVVTTCRPATWSDLEESLPAALALRLSRGGLAPLTTQGLCPAEIRELLERRLECAFPGRRRPDPLAPFSDRDLVAIASLAPGRIPAARVLEEAGARFEASTPPRGRLIVLSAQNQ